MSAGRAGSERGGVDQTVFAGGPDGGEGNCLQAAVATVMGLELGEVPHFLELPRLWTWELGEFARERSWTAVWTAGAVRPETGLLVGSTVRGTNHAVACRRGLPDWDPHPSRAGLLEAQGRVDMQRRWARGEPDPRRNDQLPWYAKQSERTASGYERAVTVLCERSCVPALLLGTDVVVDGERLRVLGLEQRAVQWTRRDEAARPVELLVAPAPAWPK